MSSAHVRHLDVRIDRPAGEVYAFARDPANLPSWAAGVGSDVDVRFAALNDYGVLDHDVTLPTGANMHVPMRVLADGPACDVVFTLRRQPGMTDADFAEDAAAVTRDLESLKRIIQHR